MKGSSAKLNKDCKTEPEEDGFSSPKPKKKRTTTTTTTAVNHPLDDDSCDEVEFEQFRVNNEDQAEEEEEEEEAEEVEEEDSVSDEERSKGKNVPLAVTLTDQEVFDCPICFEKLKNNVFQCKNGHLACDSCCAKINKTCPTCGCPIEYRCRAIEKVLEAIHVPCVNAEYGCRHVTSYSKIREHEDLCTYLRCSCPIPKCGFKGTDLNLYQHFADKKHHAINFRFRYRFSVSLRREKKILVLRQKVSGKLFVLKLFRVAQGCVISIVFIGPKSSSGSYRYELTAKDGGVTPTALHSQVESVPRLADYRPNRYFLVVEDGVSKLDFDICIRPNQ